MDDHLFEYALGNTDPTTARRIEARLADDPEAAEQFEALRAGLARLDEDRDDPEPPQGLLFATLARVAEQQCRQLPDAPTSSPYQVGGPRRRGGRPADWAAAAAILLVAGGLLVPGLIGKWRSHQREACANNLRQFWGSLSAYADLHDGAFPRVEGDGPRSVAGAVVPVLHDAGLLAAVSVACPAEGRPEPTRLGMADFEALHRDSPELFPAAARDATGSYAYALGYRQGDLLCGLTRGDGDHTPVLADRGHADGQGNSPNHGGAGQNVLYVGGHARWCSVPTVGPGADHIFVNQDQRVRAGLHRADAVLGAGDARASR